MKAIKITQEIKEKNKRYELSFVKNNNVGDVIKIGFPNKFHVTKPVSGGYKNRTDLHSKDGWKDVVIADHNPLTHRLGDIELQGDVYTHPIIQLDNETIINNVSEQLGDYLDEEYPLWERIKHTAYGSEAMLAMIQENEIFYFMPIWVSVPKFFSAETIQ